CVSASAKMSNCDNVTLKRRRNIVKRRWATAGATERAAGLPSQRMKCCTICRTRRRPPIQDRAIAARDAGGNAAAGTLVSCNANGLTCSRRVSNARASRSSNCKAGPTTDDGLEIVLVDVAITFLDPQQSDGLAVAHPTPGLRVRASMMTRMRPLRGLIRG